MKTSSWMLMCAGVVAGAVGQRTGYISDATTAAVVMLGGFILVVARRVLVLLYTLAYTPPPVYLLKYAAMVLPSFSFDSERWFRADGCSDKLAQRRKAGFAALCQRWQAKWPESLRIAERIKGQFSDVRFANSNRVFLPFNRHLNQHLDPTSVVEEADGVSLIDADGNSAIDIGGSYGVNVVGYDRYKRFIEEGWKKTGKLGCVLGPLHPLITENISMLQKVSKKQEVSFHMSGTEAVMCAVRLCRFNTGKPLAVIFGGAYHGWWDGVQSSAGNERRPADVLTLKDMCTGALNVIRMRADEIACVVVNPLQAFHPNSPPPSDLMLASNARKAQDDPSVAYREWLARLKAVCAKAGVVLLFDEVYTGFRLAPGGAQEYFECEADMVCYGKTLGGGMPVGVCCGPSWLMNRCDPKRPLRVAYVIGTFAAHPLTVGAMHSFLSWLQTDDAKQHYAALRERVSKWCADTNAALEAADVPLCVHSYSSVWTMIYKTPGRYHWMLQYYLREAGLAMSWVGTGRLNFSLDFGEAELAETTRRIVSACKRMKEDGWWSCDWSRPWAPNGISASVIQRHVVYEVIVMGLLGLGSKKNVEDGGAAAARSRPTAQAP